MAKRPPLSDQSFLAHVFGPKRNAQPSGIRKTHLSGTRGGRTKARLAAFNRMSPVNQELLKRSGLRDGYLRGEYKLGDAKEALRAKAVSLGVAKPRRPRTPIGPVIRTPLDERVARYLKIVIRGEGRPVNSQHVDENVKLIPAAGGSYEDTLTWDYGQVKYAARRGSEYEIFVDDTLHNPYWYH